MLFINGLVISALFIISLSVPILSFVLPVYKIRKIDKLPMKECIWSNIIALAIILGINKEMVFVYLLFFIPIEIMYIKFSKIKILEKFDMMIIMSTIMTIIILMSIYIFKNNILAEIDFVKEFYQKKMNFTTYEINMIMKLLKENLILYIFTYSMITVYFICVILDSNNYINWKINFAWLLLYIVPFFIKQVFEIDNFYLQNIMAIGRLIFLFYGIKTVFKFVSKNIKSRFFKDFLSFGLALTLPFVAFLVGVMGAWQQDKIEENK